MKAWVCVPGCLSANKTPVTHSGNFDSSYDNLLSITDDSLKLDEMGISGYWYELHPRAIIEYTYGY